MKTVAGTLAAPFPYFGGKSLACETVWSLLGNPVNYAEPFAGSAAMLLGRPNGWCAAHGDNPLLRIVLCGHAGEHDELLAHGWRIETWDARKGYALTDEAVGNSASEMLWCSPHCVKKQSAQSSLF